MLLPHLPQLSRLFRLQVLFCSVSRLITPMAYPSNQWASRSSVRCFEQFRVFRGSQNAEGVPIPLVKWGWGGPHITRNMGTGFPISRGSPYRAYTQCTQTTVRWFPMAGRPVRGRHAPFRSAPKIFTAVADALEWVARQRGVPEIHYYLDDFVTLGPHATADCQKNLILSSKPARILASP